MRSDLSLFIWCDAVYCIQSMFKTVCMDGTECYMIMLPFMHGSQEMLNSILSLSLSLCLSCICRYDLLCMEGLVRGLLVFLGK